MTKPLRHIASINDLSNDEMTDLFESAEGYLQRLGDTHAPHRIARGCEAAHGRVLATLFYEPSTRTRLSFESAMLRLGGQIISSADSSSSSAAKGESLADTVRVVGNYADALVIRHPRDGAARLAAEYCPIPIINGGDGAHEHPTQTLCDLFTLRQKNASLKDIHVAISGDLKGSRTVHSLVYALARFGAKIALMPAKGLELPEHVYNRLRDELNCKLEQGEESSALYVASNAPEPSPLFKERVDIRFHFDKRVDAVYVTRFQKERTTGKGEGYPTVDAEFLRDPKYSNASVMHPLPRVTELAQSLDTDKRAAYFHQAAYGVPVRMALLAAVLELEGAAPLKPYAHGFRASKHALVDQPMDAGCTCRNTNCIVHDAVERPYVRAKFHLVGGGAKLRCIYCETDIESFVVGNAENGAYSAAVKGLDSLTTRQLSRYTFFADEPAARARGLKPGAAIDISS